MVLLVWIPLNTYSSNTVGRITSIPPMSNIPPQPPIYPKSQNIGSFFSSMPSTNGFGSGFVGNMDPFFESSFRQMPHSNINGGQKRF